MPADIDHSSLIKTVQDGSAATSLSTFTSVAAGVVPASGGGTANFLRADGSWATPPDVGLTQDQIMARNVFNGPF